MKRWVPLLNKTNEPLDFCCRLRRTNFIPNLLLGACINTHAPDPDWRLLLAASAVVWAAEGCRPRVGNDLSGHPGRYRRRLLKRGRAYLFQQVWGYVAGVVRLLVACWESARLFFFAFCPHNDDRHQVILFHFSIYWFPSLVYRCIA